MSFSKASAKLQHSPETTKYFAKNFFSEFYNILLNTLYLNKLNIATKLIFNLCLQTRPSYIIRCRLKEAFCSQYISRSLFGTKEDISQKQHTKPEVKILLKHSSTAKVGLKKITLREINRAFNYSRNHGLLHTTKWQNVGKTRTFE